MVNLHTWAYVGGGGNIHLFVIMLFFAFILHSFFSSFLRALSIALICFLRYLLAFDVSTLLSPYDSNDFTTIPFDCYPLSYSSFTLFDSKRGPDRFHSRLRMVILTIRFQSEVSSPSLPSSSPSHSSIRCPPSTDSGVAFPSTTVGTKAACIV